MMERPYLVLWFALAFFGIMVGWGIYTRVIAPPAMPPQAPSTQAAPSLKEKILERRRQNEAAATTTAPAEP